MKRLFSCLQLRLIPLFAALFFIHSIASAQSGTTAGTATGTVTDSLGTPLQNVSVKVKGAKGGTATNAEGAFSLPVPSPTSTLVFSSVGYGTQEKIAGNGPINIALSTVNEALADVVIVGYTQQSQTKTTAAISKLNITELQNRPSPNPVQALQGKIAGVSVPINSGQPGAGATNIIIRGGTKLNVYGSGLGNANGNPIGSADNTGPLVVIDGVFRSMDDINPDNIETFQVMKDAASTAIYGARGANGVIVIKTKGGKFNTKMNITLNHRSTWETQSRDYNYLSATEYLRLARTTVKNTYDLLDKNNLLYNGGFSAGTRPFTAKGQFGTIRIYNGVI